MRINNSQDPKVYLRILSFEDHECNSGMLTLTIVISYLLEGRSFLDLGFKYKMSWRWRNLFMIRPYLTDSFYSQVRNEETTFMWYDNWHQLGQLSYFLHPRRLLMLVLIQGIKSMRWLLLKTGTSLFWLRMIPQLGDYPVTRLIREKKRWCLWMNGKRDIVPFAVNQVSSSLIGQNSKVAWDDLLWFQHRIPNYYFILWLAILGKLWTQDIM